MIVAISHGSRVVSLAHRRGTMLCAVSTLHCGTGAALCTPGRPTARLRQAWVAQRAKSPPRTIHTNNDGSPKYINRLVLETSPYLQQHAFNPVNWYPWGDEAFARARQENKPVFLSIGYSTCHWCHVMERECFENEAIARQLNEQFVAIKVDREERPDVDNVYVAAVQRMTGGAGWPLTVFLTPDRRPFYGGTYFPPEDRYGKPGLPKLLTTVTDLWKTKHEDVVQASTALTQSLQPPPESTTTANLTADTLRKGYELLARAFDATNGGFGGAPKFPQAHMLQFLLRYWQRSAEAQARHMSEETLERMARGGIHDQLGGGFHRYATDAQWVVPHFEKMLYDQAINARAYLEAAQASGARRYAEVARGIFTYVLRDLAAPAGGFYAAEDADSEGEEGRFYLWSRADIIAALGRERGPLIADFCGVTGQGLLPGGRSPLHIPTPPAAFIKQRGLEAPEFTATLSAARQSLLAVRNRRPRPLRDDKIITAWNGLMISSLAYGSTVLGDPQYAMAAGRAADFVLTHLQRDGRLMRSFRKVASPTRGYLDDYAFFILGLTDLYSATLDVRWLREADRLSRDMLRLFADPARGGLRYSAKDAEQLIATSDDHDDGALPSAESVAALVLLRLGRLTVNQAFETQGRALLAANSHDLATAPTAHTEMLMALDFALGPTKEITVAGAPDAAGTQALLATVRHHYLPRSVLALHSPNDATIEALVPFLKEQRMINGKPTAYVCENYVCKLPTNDPQRLDKLLADGAVTIAEKK
jgi:uncharacterized protein YyaL (SSP411 family)